MAKKKKRQAKKKLSMAKKKKRQVKKKLSILQDRIIVSAGFTGVVSTGSYENARPSYTAEIETHGSIADIAKLQVTLQDICFANFEEVARKAKIQKIQNDRKDFRFYPASNGEQYVSVTSILNYDSSFFVSEDELKQYAAQGTIIDAQVKEYIKTKQWKALKDIEGIAAEIFILKIGSLHLSLDGWDFPAMLAKYPQTKMRVCTSVFNDEHKYAGTPDYESVFGTLATLNDVKRTPDKVKNLMQMAAYAKCKGMEHIKQLMIVPINDKTEQGFSKPIITTEIDKYFELFIAKRKEFKKVYGI